VTDRRIMRTVCSPVDVTASVIQGSSLAHIVAGLLIIIGSVCWLVAGNEKAIRACMPKLTFNWTGCKSASFAGSSGNVCVCDTDLCNAARVSRSSVTHVIMAGVITLVMIGRRHLL